ncbi:MAG: hypothetical protein ACTSQJ_09720 [Promethearchaeota archaeon]
MESDERFIECRYCEYQCKYRSIAEKNMKADEEYTKKFFDLFREGDLDAVAEHIAKETIKIMETKSPEALLALGVCLYVIGTNILEIPDVLRRRLGRLAKSKIRTALKEELGLAVPPPVKAVAAPAAAVKVPAAVVKAPAEEAPAVAPAEEVAPAAVPAVEEVSPAAALEEWLRSDKEFLYYVDEIIQQKDNLIAVKYDLETEGFLRGVLIKILYSARDASGNRIMKLGIKSRVDVPYHLNIIMGKTKEGIVATSIPGDLKNEEKLYEILQTVDTKEALQMDRLTLMLNRDKFLKKAISNVLILDSPNESKVRSIKVPITIEKRGEQGCDLVVRTFFKESRKPTDLFINIMDGIAENMDYLLELPPEERKEVPMAKSDWFTIKVKPQMGSFSSKFIKRVALPDIPTCPHCDRPLPQASSTDYRRCPFCYEKL